jgi:hypothetical protein
VPLRLRGFKKFVRAFNRRRAKRKLDSEEGRKMRQAVLYLRSEVLDYIDSAKHGVPNAPLTVLIKGSDAPLVDRGDLRLGIVGDVDYEGGRILGGVGVLRTRRTKDGKKLMNVAAALHNGFTIRVTPAVRAAVFAELRKRQGKGVRADSSGRRGGGATTWKVKGRPFILEPFLESEKRIIEILGEGVRVTFKKL